MLLLTIVVLYCRHRHQVDHQCPDLPQKQPRVTPEERIQQIIGESNFCITSQLVVCINLLGYNVWQVIPHRITSDLMQKSS